MEDLPRQKLRDLMSSEGRSLCDDPRRCEALLRDVCGAHGREVNLLVTALKQGIATDLLGSQSGIPPAVVAARLTKRLDNLGFTEDAARWAVDSWAYALGLPVSPPPKYVETAEPAAVKKPVPPGVEPPPAGGGTGPVRPVRDIDKGPPK